MIESANMQEVAGTRVRGRGVWEHFTVLDGLPDMKVECLFEDSDGGIWVGTHDGGAARFDGERFVCYSTEDGLSSDSIYSVTEDKSGNLWFATNRGLTRYDGTTFEIIDASLDYSFLWGSCMDEAGDLWFGLDRRPGRPAGVVRWDANDLELIEAEESEGISIHAVAQVSGLLIAIGHVSYSVQGKGLLELPWQLSDARASATVDDRMAIVTAGDGIYEVSATSAEKVSTEGGAESVVVHDGKIWAATSDSEITEFDRKGNSQKRKSPVASLWRGMQVDGRGRLWVSGFGGGVCCYDDSILRLLDTDEMPRSSVLAVEVDRDGTTWIGTAEGLWAVSVDGKLFAPPQRHGLSSISVTSLCVSDTELWVGTRNGLVYSILEMTISSRDSPPELRGLSIAQIVAVMGRSTTGAEVPIALVHSLQA